MTRNQSYLMTEFTTDRKISSPKQQLITESKVKNITDLKIKVSILCLSTFYYGYCLAYLSTLSQNTIIKTFGSQTQNTTVKGFLIGVLTLGGAVGAFTSPFWMKCFSRGKLILIFNLLALIISGAIQYPNLYCLFVCRGFQGFVMGNFMALVPVYINEISPKQIVTFFGVFTQLFVVFGIIFAYGFGIFLTKIGLQDEIMWRIMFGFDIITISSVTLSCLFKFIPQSPNSLIIEEKFQQAKEVIGLYVKKQFVEQVFNQKVLEVQHELNKKVQKQDQGLFYSKKAYFVGFLLPLMQQATGINAVVTQIGGIVSSHSKQFGFYTPLIINVVQFLATICAIYVLQYFGRKPTILFGNFGLGLCDILLGVLFFFIDKSQAIFWVILGILMIYMLFYGLTIGPTVWMYVPEVIPAKIVPFATTLNWLASSFCLIIAPIINESLGSFAVFFIFGGLTLIIGFVNSFFIVEIKGLTVREICQAYN